MLSEEIKEVFVLEEARLEKQRHEFDARLAAYEGERMAELKSKKWTDESRSSLRWIIFTIFTVNITVAIYMTVIFSYHPLH